MEVAHAGALSRERERSRAIVRATRATPIAARGIPKMAAIAATRCTAPVTIHGAECVQKSYPAFFEDYAKLGGLVTREG